MSVFPLVNELTEVEIPLESIYLDPNNPRFIGPEWAYVPDEDIDKESVQDNVRRRLVNQFRVDRLKMNMEINGYLPIDRVIVREFIDSKYVVLEGNRRICAAKMAAPYTVDGSAVSEEILESFKVIPCLQYIGSDSRASWIFQGLRHIMGINDWSQFNKARLLVEQMEEEGLALTEVGKRFGLTPYGAGQWVRGYYAFKQAREESDYINEVDERSYTYFQELFSRSSAPVREWMEWDDNERHFGNGMNFNEFIGWIYPKIQEEESETDVFGDWDNRIIQRQDHVRKIAYLIREAPDIFEKFRLERDKDIERAYSEALAREYQKEAMESYDPGEEVFKTIKEFAKALDNIPYKILRDEARRSSLITELDSLEELISSIKNA